MGFGGDPAFILVPPTRCFVILPSLQTTPLMIPLIAGDNFCICPFALVEPQVGARTTARLGKGLDMKVAAFACWTAKVNKPFHTRVV